MLFNSMSDGTGQGQSVIRELDTAIFSTGQVDQLHPGLEGLPLCFIVRMVPVCEQRQFVRSDTEETTGERFFIFFKFVTTDFTALAFPHGFQVGKVVLVERCLEVELM